MPDIPFDTTRYATRYRILRDEQSTWRTTWFDCAQYFAPRRGRYLISDTDDFANNGRKKNHRIINGRATGAVRTFGAGLQGGLTSPVKPWCEFGLPDQDLAKYGPVKAWLDDCRDRMLRVFAGSNYYSANHGNYEELGIFGIASKLIDADFKTIINCRPFTIGEFCIGLDAQYRPDTLYRAFSMAVSQMRSSFGSKLPKCVSSAVDNQRWDQRFEVLHVIEPAAFQDLSKADYRGMAYHSCYMLKGHDDEGILRKSGYKTRPFSATTWGTYGVDAYGDSPGIQALGDQRMLQRMEEDKLRALALMVKPPMVGPASLRNGGATLIPGGITFVDQTAGTQGFVPAFQPNVNLQQLGAEIQNVEKRIDDFFYSDLFLAILNQTKDMTATEVAQRYEEKLSMLGPAIERISEGLDNDIDRTWSIMDDFGLFAPPPPELKGGMPITVNYISTLAQAQKLVGTQPIQDFVQFVGATAPIFPTVVDKINSDVMIDLYADAKGISPKMINSDQVVAQIRQQKAQVQKTAAMTNAAPALADAAKSASQATLGDDTNALQVMTGRKS